jgi:hypothetical protein
VLRTAPAEGLLLGFRAEYSVTAQTEPKTKTCFGFPKPRPMTREDLRMIWKEIFFLLFVFVDC